MNACGVDRDEEVNTRNEASLNPLCPERDSDPQKHKPKVQHPRGGFILFSSNFVSLRASRVRVKETFDLRVGGEGETDVSFAFVFGEQSSSRSRFFPVLPPRRGELMDHEIHGRLREKFSGRDFRGEKYPRMADTLRWLETNASD